MTLAGYVLTALALFAGLAFAQESPLLLVSTNYCLFHHSIVQNMVHVILNVVLVAGIYPYHLVSAHLGPM